MNAPDMVGPDGLFRRRKDSVNGIKLHSVVGGARGAKMAIERDIFTLEDDDG